VDDLSDAWDYERDGDVGIWYIHDFAALFGTDEMDRAEKHYRETASEDAMDGTVVVIRNTDDLGQQMRETLEHVNDHWSQLAEETGIGRVAYVTDGIFSIAVRSELEADVESQDFEEVPEAVAWAR
jgi:hypothetical protein